MKLLDAARAFQAEWIGIEPARCLNFRHRIEFCEVCVQACPRDAVSVSVDEVAITPEQCNNCGLCVADCPTGVFSHDYYSPMKLMSWARGKPAIELFCQFAGAETLGGCQARIPCHGVLDGRVLAALLAAGVEEVAVHGLEQCDGCPTGIGGARLRALMDELPAAPRIVIADGETPTSEADAASPDATALYAEPELDRRGFLAELGRRVTRAAADSTLVHLIEEEQEGAPAGGDALAVKHVPAYHRAALTALFARRIAAADVAGGKGWFHDIQADEKCTGCQTCAVRCPTGALAWQDTGDRVELTYRTAACIGCGLCVSVCPYDALTLTPQADDTALLEDRITTLFASRQLTCSVCGDRFLPHDGDNRYCWVCKNERELDDEWMRMIAATGRTHDSRS